MVSLHRYCCVHYEPAKHQLGFLRIQGLVSTIAATLSVLGDLCSNSPSCSVKQVVFPIMSNFRRVHAFVYFGSMAQHLILLVLQFY